MTMSVFCATSLPFWQTLAPPATRVSGTLPIVSTEELMPGGLQVARHRGAHDAEADESDFAHRL